MAKNRIPDEIAQYRPGPCTEIKPINGHYYVYMYSSCHLDSGNWGKKTGKSIGTIIANKGFIPNKNYAIYKQEIDDTYDIKIVEYGQYALVYDTAKEIRDSLKKHFPLDVTEQIFAYATIIVVNNLVHTDQINMYYEQSWLSIINKDFTFKMGKTAIGSLLDDLGRRNGKVLNYQKAAIEKCTSMAIDGHVIRSCSDKNDLAEAGYKFNMLKEDQVNFVMGYDLVSEMPLFSRIYRGSTNDKSTISDLNNLLSFSGIMFVVDRGFYSTTNLEIFSKNDNSYIIPVPATTNTFKKAMSCVKYIDSFYYIAGKTHARIEYMEIRHSDTEFVYVFRDLKENEDTRFNYLRNIEIGKNGYTKENFEKNKEFFGVYVLQTNRGLSPEQVFKWYKKRWGIETVYQYMKNKVDFNDLMFQDYYKEQGFTFIMLIVAQIEQCLLNAEKKLNNNTISVRDILLMARRLKMEIHNQSWNLKNEKPKELEILERFGFIPSRSISA